jgi:hypothetical protein
VVCNHLLPLARQQLRLEEPKNYDGNEACTTSDDNSLPTIVGYEWWVHTRSVAANLGHNLHFDTDEAWLNSTGEVSHPILSSVLYLTSGGGAKSNDTTGQGGGGRSGGATVIFDQTPDSVDNAERAWCSLPIDNSFMVFPGSLLHGVLPCLGQATEGVDGAASANGSSMKDESDATELVSQLQQLLATDGDESKVRQPITDTTPHRLTLMVGFWTRRVPDSIPKFSTPIYYGPCGPLPPAKNAAWVRAMEEGYSKSSAGHPTAMPSSAMLDHRKSIVRVPLPSVSPAWEEMQPDVADDSEPADAAMADCVAPLEIPPAIDHRFFVRDAPQCFHPNRTLDVEESDDDEEDGDEDDDDDEDEDDHDEDGAE